MAVLLLLGVLAAASPAAAGPSCAPFNDPGCFFGETFESYAVGTSPAEWNLHPPEWIPVIVPGPDGAGHRLQGTVPARTSPAWVANGSCEGCPGGEHSGSATVPRGSRYWLELSVTFGPDYRWGQFPSGNCSAKLIDWRGVTGKGRILLTLWQCPNDSAAHLQVSMYPNYAAGGSDAGAATNCCTEKFSNVGRDVPFVGGGTYHVIVEVLVGSGSAGAYKVWVNGTKTHDFSRVQTADDDPWTFSSVGLGGPLAAPNPGSKWWWNRIRLTTTNIAPGAP